MPGFRLVFADKPSYNHCLNNFCATYGFDGTKTEKEEFVKAKVIEFLVGTSESEYVKKKTEEAHATAKAESVAILSANKITTETTVDPE